MGGTEAGVWARHRRRIVAGVAFVTLSFAGAPALGPVARAQTLSAANELSVSGLGGGVNCSALPTLASQARVDGPFGALAVEGAIGTHEDRSPRARGEVLGEVRLPEWRGFSVRSMARISSPAPIACGLQARQRAAGIELAYRAGEGGYWVGYQWRANDPALTPIPTGLWAGAWQSVGRVMVSLSIGTQADTGTRTGFRSREVIRLDSIPNDTTGGWNTYQVSDTVIDTTTQRWRGSAFESRARLSWTEGPWSTEATLGVLWRRDGSGVSPWGTLESTLALSPRLAIIGGLLLAPDRALVAVPSRRMATLGFRVSTTPAVPARPAEPRPSTRRFTVRRAAGENVVLALHAPHARYVEITGDFTMWRAQRMERAADGWWELPVRLPTGRYRVNVRVDGQGWTHPPGLPTARDEFGGTVGVLVLP